MLPLRAVPALLAILVLLGSAPAAAQIEPPRPVDELAPDGPAQRPVRTRREPRPAPPPVASPEEDETQDPQAAEPPRPPPPPVRRPGRGNATAAPAAPAPASAAPAAPARDRTPPPPLLVPAEGDDAILSTFHAWRDAERARDPKASRTARDRLAELRETLAIADLESVSLALLRGARVRAAGKDGAGAVELGALVG